MSLRNNPCFILETEEGILLKIEDICLQVIKLISEDVCPSLCYPRRLKWIDVKYIMNNKINCGTSWICGEYHTYILACFKDTLDKKTDLQFTKVQFLQSKPKSAKKFATMLKILKIIYSLVQENRYCTKRDIFYQHPDLYPCQSFIDRIIDDIASMLNVPRQELHILATSKGLVSGDLQFENSEGNLINCWESAAGVPIAANSKDIQTIHTRAKFVLVVEKDATFQNLMNHHFCEKIKNCILITGKGFPDNATRMLLQKIYISHRLPIFILVDADPHGIEIMAVYKYGSKNQVFDNKTLAIPSVKWIGILPEDIKSWHIPDSSLISLSSKHLQMCVNLKDRPYFQKDEYVLSQIDFLIEMGKKAEIQCLDAISSNYLSDIYLPRKLMLLT